MMITSKPESTMSAQQSQEDGISLHYEEPSSRENPFAERQGHTMQWKHVNVAVNEKKKKRRKKKEKTDEDEKQEPQCKKLLDEVWGQVVIGEITAIMGPSGSGKTTLLNVLAGRLRNNHKLSVQSDVLLDGVKVDCSDMNYRQKIAFVAQDDSLQVTATPREAIAFSARLRLPKSTTKTEIKNLTDSMLDELHLKEAADTIIGGALIKGISGGERKRTSVGVELVTQPAIVFLDEPSSGLDSYNALELCIVLKKVATAGSSVLFTIHQPSSEIFRSLDRLILLNKGRVMYEGLCSEVPAYFAQRGYECPAHFNPADYVMDIAQSVSQATLEEHGFFANEDEIAVVDGSPDEDATTTTTLLTTTAESQKVGVLTQTKLLLAREVKNVKRNKRTLAARTGMTTFVSVLAGCLFFQVAQSDFRYFINVQSTFGALLLSCLANVFSTALPSLVAFPEERPVFLREYSTNHYSVTAYFASRLAMEATVTAAQVLLSSLITYFLIGFTANFGLFWSVLYLLAMTSTALGVMIGCAVKDPGTAMEFLPLIFMPQILFAGFFVPPDLIPVWLRWLSYIFPLTYAVRIVLILEFDDGRCDEYDPPIPTCDTVLYNVNANPDEEWWYWLVLICMFAFFRLLALYILKRKAQTFY